MSRGDYAELKPVYSLNLLNDVMNPDVPECYHHYALSHRTYRDKTIDGIQLVFVELPVPQIATATGLDAAAIRAL